MLKKKKYLFNNGRNNTRNRMTTTIVQQQYSPCKIYHKSIKDKCFRHVLRQTLFTSYYNFRTRIMAANNSFIRYTYPSLCADIVIKPMIRFLFVQWL